MKVTRRRFFYLAAGTGGALMLRPPGFQAYSRKSWALGSDTSITLWHDDSRAAGAALTDAFETIDAVEDLMSLYRPSSQLCQLNQLGALENPHPDLLQVMRYAQRLSESSAGAFDITVQPLWLSELGDRPHRVDDLDLVDWRQLKISATQIRFGKLGMQATLNGIAQGFAADKVAATLARHGIRHALIDTGEIASLGKRKGTENWNVGVQHPRNEEAFLCLTGLSDRCLATSGDYATTFTDDFSQHHLIDPSTGHSPQELSSVTVAASSAMEADALSTAAFVLGLQKGMALIEQVPGADAMMVRKTDGRSFASREFPIIQPS